MEDELDQEVKEDGSRECGAILVGALLGGFAGLFAGYLYLRAGAGTPLAWGSAAGGTSAGPAILILGAIFFGGGATALDRERERTARSASRQARRMKRRRRSRARSKPRASVRDGCSNDRGRSRRQDRKSGSDDWT